MSFRGAPLSVAVELIMRRPIATTMPANVRRTDETLLAHPEGVTMADLRAATLLTHKAQRIALEHLIYVAHRAEIVRHGNITLYRSITVRS